MKVLVYTPVYLRASVTRIYVAGLQRLKNRRNIDVLCVVSPGDDENKKILKEAKIKTVEAPNSPLGRKKNIGLAHAKKIAGWDYLLELNSDDVIKDELLEIYDPYMNNGEKFIGIQNFIFYDLISQKAKELNRPTMYGIGRAYRRDIIPDIMWPNDKDRGMDNYSECVLKSKGIEPKRITTDKPLAIDFKSDFNLWGYESRPGKEISIDDALSTLSDTEKKLIREYATEKN